MTETITPADLAQQLKESFADLCNAVDRLTPDEIEQTRLEDGWTPKAILAHVAFWDDYQTRRMEAAYRGDSAATGFSRPPGDNDERAAHDQARPWAEVAATASAARQRMIAFAESLPVDALTTEYREGERTLSIGALLQHMVRHTREHTQALNSPHLVRQSGTANTGPAN